MAQYRMLAPHWINNTYMDAGTIQQTADIPGGLLPQNWRPSGSVEALDAAAVTAVYAAGPQTFGLLRGQFGFVNGPITYWLATPQPHGVSKWQLVGLGQALAPIFL